MFDKNSIATDIVGLDLNKQKEESEQLEDNSGYEFCSAVFNSVKDHISILDESGNILETNDTWKKFAENANAKPEAVNAGTNYFTICHNAISNPRSTDKEVNDAQKALEGMQKVLTGGLESFSCIYPCDFNGRQRWFEMHVVLLQSKQKGLVVIHRDISKRIELERQLIKKTQQLRRFKKQLEAENSYLIRDRERRKDPDKIIGESDALKYVLFRVADVASTDANVLIMGETGTGKELIASAVHQASKRSGRPMVVLNCAALSENIIESELFQKTLLKVNSSGMLKGHIPAQRKPMMGALR